MKLRRLVCFITGISFAGMLLVGCSKTEEVQPKDRKETDVQKADRAAKKGDN